MKTASKIIPFLKNHDPISKSQIFQSLSKVKFGKLAKKLLKQCEAGMSPHDFAAIEAKPKFKQAVSALAVAQKTNDTSRIIWCLKGTAFMFYRLKRLDSEIPWRHYAEIYPCLKEDGMEPGECRGTRGCERILGHECGSVLGVILLRHDILSREGGIFADRLISALELGVPYERIKAARTINLPVALGVLKEFFPDINEDKLRKLSADL